ncbi:uncharacterized protein STEHIDRAFT_113324 [Stereum hirsutum FP-91666 SS1]|uniref:uncharacterized protein n=1 Tax=Stereum hirsutum (strain FP-91666) TaxID=721885 RepID=UPI000444A0D6|nr:uncharacterized protein STEHIDRAFT_113324 [Stereum hirsutum FP-91666 SS1]EIM84144.1 hypothetical protein STEHIDRAFT_113324 [Stereum hirsutum FP-91666 SS1]
MSDLQLEYHPASIVRACINWHANNRHERVRTAVSQHIRPIASDGNPDRHTMILHIDESKEKHRREALLAKLYQYRSLFGRIAVTEPQGVDRNISHMLARSHTLTRALKYRTQFCNLAAAIETGRREASSILYFFLGIPVPLDSFIVDLALAESEGHQQQSSNLGRSTVNAAAVDDVSIEPGALMMWTGPRALQGMGRCHFHSATDPMSSVITSLPVPNESDVNTVVDMNILVSMTCQKYSVESPNLDTWTGSATVPLKAAREDPESPPSFPVHFAKLPVLAER